MLVYLSLGANLGNREQTIDKAVQLLSEQIGPLIKRSSFFYSKPWGFDSPNDFCNLCVSFTTSLSPLDLLRTTQSIERQLGRTHKSNGTYQDRSIDIDIIRAFDDHGEEIQCEIPNPNSPISSLPLLTIPHPLWQQRDFVKVPLQQIMH
ncbi:MAG: 2-amino-4-hydroxy-6-hydroxymethyldihydropteridine diphosphokinase [Paludibacteraceae bacterium]|nr:2-amino-4-hydroxy-6-hydroxymethyldihydropteridine diphosphokinase [Paludibacteraceae bacterium]